MLVYKFNCYKRVATNPHSSKRQIDQNLTTVKFSISSFIMHGVHLVQTEKKIFSGFAFRKTVARFIVVQYTQH